MQDQVHFHDTFLQFSSYNLMNISIYKTALRLRYTAQCYTIGEIHTDNFYEPLPHMRLIYNIYYNLLLHMDSVTTELSQPTYVQHADSLAHRRGSGKAAMVMVTSSPTAGARAKHKRDNQLQFRLNPIKRHVYCLQPTIVFVMIEANTTKAQFFQSFKSH